MNRTSGDESPGNRDNIAWEKSEGERVALLKAIFDTSPVGLAVLDRDLRYIWVNKTLARMNMVPQEDHIGKTLREIIPYIADKAEHVARGVLETGEPLCNMLFSSDRASEPGKVHHWNVHLFPLKDGDGRIIGVSTTVEEVTDRIRTEEELSRSEERYRKAQKVGHVGSWEYDIRTERFWGSDEARVIFGLDPDQHDFSTEDIESCILERERVHQALVDLVQGGKEYNLEYEILTRDSSQRKIIWSMAEVQRDYNGEPYMVAGTIQDITERKRHEANLAFLARLAEDLPGLGAADEIIQTVGNKVGTYLNVSACLFAEINRAEGKVGVEYLWSASGMPDVTGEYMLSEFVTDEFRRAARSGETIVVRNTQTDPGTNAGHYAEFNVHAYVCVPFHQGGEWRYMFIVHNPSARDWREDEIELIQEVTNFTFPRFERARAEEALSQSEERLNFALETSHTGAWDLDLIDHTAYRSLEHDRIFGYEELLKEWTYEMFLDHVVPEDRPWVDEQFRKAISAHTNWGFECRIRRVDGEVRWIWAAGRHRDDSSGKTRRMAGIVQDITERKRAEEDFRESEQRFRIMADSTPLIIWMTNEKGEIQFVNRAHREFFGVTVEQIVGLNWRPHVHPDDERSYVQAFMEAVHERKPFRAMGRVLRADGEWRWLESFGNPRFSPDGSYLGHVGGSPDITDRIDAENELGTYRQHLEDLVKARTMELEEKNRELKEEILEREKAEAEKRKVESQLAQAQRIEAIDRFAGGIAHDLNNILYPIIINIEDLLGDEPHGSARREILDQTLKAAYRQRDLVKKILSFSRRSERVNQLIGIKALLEETLDFLRSSLPSTISIKQNFSAQNDVIMGDPVQIQQVIMNLFKNAADALELQKGTIEVELANTRMRSTHERHGMKTGDYLRMSVRDTGHGMRPEIMDRIFEPFYTSKGVGKGTGMGLSVVHGIVKSHGGSITVESEEGKGSVFTVYLPLGNTEQLSQAQQQHSAPSAQGKEKILLIDDEEIILSSIKRVLKASGYRVVAVKDGATALDLFRNEPDEFDLIITDLTMPGMTGLELSRKAQKIRPGIPIVLCTGFNDAISEQEANSLGIRELLLKPADSKELKKTVRKALEQ